jgi:predicted Fe-S protein YdhL (DUF1289 family)
MRGTLRLMIPTASRPPMPAPIRTPCIGVCAVDGETGWCLGCGRTLVEITAWSRASEHARETVLETLDARMERLFVLGKLGPVKPASRFGPAR